jgi:Cd2+/Zn2+-exporting ATPase
MKTLLRRLVGWCVRSAGIRHIHMLTGDERAVAERVAADIGVDRFSANLLPEDKLSFVEKLESTQQGVLFAGDGINDDPRRLVTAIAIAKRTRRIVMGNIVFALSAKIVFLLLGSLGLAGMWEAIFADVGVTLLAVLNSMRVLRG